MAQVIYTVYYYDGKEKVTDQLPKLPNYNIKYVKDNFGRCRIPTKAGWIPESEENCLGRTKPFFTRQPQEVLPRGKRAGEFPRRNTQIEFIENYL